MLEKLDLEKVLFLDIETVPQYPAYDDVPEDWKPLWDKKAKFLSRNDENPDELYERAGIYAEFGKIVCISVGILSVKMGEKQLRVKSYANDDETVLLAGFCELLNEYFNTRFHLLCAHNGKEFDFPYIARRLLINGMKLPGLLDIAGKKPWEISHLDTMELWKFGDYKNFTSLQVLSAVFGIPTPKDDIDGSQVAAVYYEENNLDRIVRYCQKDVVTLVRLLLKYRGEALLEDNAIIEVD